MVESNVRLERQDPLWILTSTILYSIGMKMLLARHRLFCSTRTPLFLSGYNVNSPWWSSSRKYWFISQGQGSKVNENKLGQLRKYIFDIEIERVSSFQYNQYKRKENFLELIKLFRYKVYHVGINRLYDSLIERNRKKRYVAAILKGLRITEVMSKPNDLKQRKEKGSQNKQRPFQLSQ